MYMSVTRLIALNSNEKLQYFRKIPNKKQVGKALVNFYFI